MSSKPLLQKQPLARKHSMNVIDAFATHDRIFLQLQSTPNEILFFPAD